MNENTGGLDRFRMAAAFLVVAIHTSPLASYSALGDFILTRIIARLAVPFFLMTTGYFALGDYVFGKDPKRLHGAMKKTALLYFVSALIYLPLGLYAGHYEGLNFLSALKMLIFDGTFYHLWYLPAAVMGLGLIRLLGRRLPAAGLLGVSAALYAVGLLGDSYYGLIAETPASAIYDIIFTFTDFTRNGLFFAPLFLMLGAYARRTDIARPPLALALSLGAMTAEALTLRFLGCQRHDSMYIFLPFCTFALFDLLLSSNSRPSKRLRTVAAAVYIIHPWFIAVLPPAARLLYAGKLLEENSLPRYLAVCLLSLAAALIFTKLLPERQPPCRSWIELDMGALENNAAVLRSRLPEGCDLMPAVKADAYGHGAAAVAKRLNRLGVRSFCVATVEEGDELRRSGVRGEILVLGCAPPSRVALARRRRLTLTAADFEHAKRLAAAGKKIKVHLAVDTGMNRLGERAENFDRILSVFEMKNLRVTGLFTHLCASDGKDGASAEFTKAQAESFFELTEKLRGRGFRFKAHILNSGGAVNYPELGGDGARVGIALYGVMSTASATDSGCDGLIPVLSLKSEISLIKEVKNGENIGYGLSCRAERDMRLAVLPIGYADGLPRSLSNGAGSVIVGGEYAPIVGRVCMDQMMVDVTGVEAAPGDTAIIIGQSGDKRIRACDMAEAAGTISNEILSRLGKRLPRVTL